MAIQNILYVRLLAFPSCVTVGSKGTRVISVFLRVVTTNETGQNIRLFIHLVCNGNMKADRNAARLSA